MQRRFYTPVLLLLMLMIGSACSRTPDHARHIPPDALCIVGVNTREISREIAWNALSGSELFRKLKERSRHTPLAEALSQLEHAGIRFSSTIYMFLRTDRRYDENLQTTLLVPLSDVSQWEAYVKRVFPRLPIRQREGYREILVEGEAVVGWDKKLLVVMNVVQRHSPGHTTEVDTQQTSAGIADLFLTTRQKGITADKRFRKMGKERHDLTLWVNYDAAMAHTLGSGFSGLATMGIAGALWRGAILTTGIDFERGRIRGTLKYYVPETLQEIYRTFGDTGPDKEMLDRIPSQNLYLLAGGRVPVDGVRQLLDQTGLSSIAALFLVGSGLTADQALDAFAGDVIVAVNDFKQVAVNAGGHTEMNFLSALKIGRRDAFDKLVAFAVAENILIPAGKNTYTISNKDIPGTIIIVDQKYAVIANTPASAHNWLQARERKEELPAPAIKILSEHAAGLFVNTTAGDVNGSDARATANALLHYISANSTPFRDGAYTASIEVAFRNEKENSLLQLLDLLLRTTDG